MRNIALMPLVVAALMTATTDPRAQNNTPPSGTVEQPSSSAKQPGNNSGTAPENMGATGWSGGSRGQTQDSATGTGQANSGTNSEAAKDQPVMATGEDLKGPPAQFPANKTPE